MRIITGVFFLFCQVFVGAQNTITINKPGVPATVTINKPGVPATVTVNKSTPVDYSPVDYEGAINNTLQNLTADEVPLYYYGWPSSYAYQDKRGFMARRGTIHGNDPNSDMIRFQTNDGSNTWLRDSFYSEPGYDIRNYAGGSTSKGTILIFFGRWNSSSTWVSIRCLRSVNGLATKTISADLPLYTDSLVSFSPYGSLVEIDDTLKQTFYGTAAGGTCFIWTNRSIDDGVTWSDPALIATGTALYEPAATYLGGGKGIAVIRHDLGPTDKDLEIYNSSDHMNTWSYVGKGTYTPSGFDIPGVSPLAFKKNADTAYIVATNRSANNSFIQIEMPFGSATSNSYRRLFYDGLPAIDADNLEFGYPAYIQFNTSDTAKMAAFYDASAEWISGGAKTDMLVTPLFQKKRVVTTRTSGTVTSGSLYAPTLYIEDELPSYNVPTNSGAYHKIPESGTYTVRVEATFTGSGSSRTLNVNRYTSGQVFIETMDSESGSGNSYDFTTPNLSLTAGQLVGVQITHDASPLTYVSFKLTIIKQ